MQLSLWDQVLNPLWLCFLSVRGLCGWLTRRPFTDSCQNTGSQPLTTRFHLLYTPLKQTWQDFKVLAALCYHSVKWFSEKKRLAEPCSFIQSKRWTGALAACIPGAAEWLNIKKENTAQVNPKSCMWVDATRLLTCPGCTIYRSKWADWSKYRFYRYYSISPPKNLFNKIQWPTYWT